MSTGTTGGGPFFIIADRIPEFGDVVTLIRGTTTPQGVRLEVSFERRRHWYARSMIADPRTLAKWSLKLFWQDFKGFLRGHPKRPIERVCDALGEDA